MNYLRTAILLAGLTALFMGVGFLIGGQSGALIALVVAAGDEFRSPTGMPTGSCCRCMARTKSTRARAPELYRIVGELAARAGLPMPRVYLMDNPQPNAFATGRNPQARGGRSHHRTFADADARRNRRRDRARARPHQEPRHADHDDHGHHRRRHLDAGAVRPVLRRRNRDSNNGMGMIGTLAMVILAPIAAMLVQMAISRTREYGADAMGARISGRPLALASALARIDNAAHQIENPDAEQHPATAHLFIINPLSGARMDNLFATHPATENRIAALQEIAARMGQRGRECRAAARPSGPWGGASPRSLGVSVSRIDAAARARLLARDRPTAVQPELRACRPGASPPTSWMACCAGGARSTSCSMAGRPRRSSTQLADRDRALARHIVATALRRLGSLPPPARPVSRPRLAEGRAARRVRAAGRARRSSCFSTFPTTRRSISPVRLARADRRAARYSGLANAVLRRIARQRSRHARRGRHDRCSIRPAWLMARWTQPLRADTARAIALANRAEPALDLTVKSDPRGLGGARSAATLLPTGSVRLIPHGPCAACRAMTRAPGGCRTPPPRCRCGCSATSRGRAVADLCAAPGGKTAQLARRGASHRGRSLDRPARAAARESRASRPAADMSRPTRELAAGPFDAVLIDAPCSSTGTIRRHPDIAWLKQAADFAGLSSLQDRLLRHAVDCPGRARRSCFAPARSNRRRARP